MSNMKPSGPSLVSFSTTSRLGAPASILPSAGGGPMSAMVSRTEAMGSASMETPTSCFIRGQCALAVAFTLPNSTAELPLNMSSKLTQTYSRTVSAKMEAMVLYSHDTALLSVSMLRERRSIVKLLFLDDSTRAGSHSFTTVATPSPSRCMFQCAVSSRYADAGIPPIIPDADDDDDEDDDDDSCGVPDRDPKEHIAQ